MKQLNLLIFNDILPYLLFKLPFKQILEFSLLCKSIFKSISNLITHNQKLIKFYPRFNNLIIYIKNNKNTKNNNNNNNNNNQLFKLKEIESIYLKIQKQHYNNNDFTLFEIFKNQIINYCSGSGGGGNKLKNIIFINFYEMNCFINTDTNTDITFNGFYKFEKVEYDWNEIKWRDDSILVDGDSSTSFEFIPKSIFENQIKIKFSAMYLHLKNLNNFLIKCQESNSNIKSIKFNSHETPYEFIIQLFNNDESSTSLKNHLESLSVRLSIFSFEQLIHIFDDSSLFDASKNILIDFNTSEIISKLFNMVNIKNNKVLKKLKLNKGKNWKSPNNQDPSLFLNILVGNDTLNSLGLELYENISSTCLLSPLIKISNITKLYCNFESIKIFLQHCNENSNIKTLVIDDSNDKSYYTFKILNIGVDNHNDMFTNFFKSNKSIETIIFKKINQNYFDNILKINKNLHINLISK